MKATLTLCEEFESIICEHCGQEFLLFNVWRKKRDFGEDITDILTQVSTKERPVYCPYCGEKTFKDERLKENTKNTKET